MKKALGQGSSGKRKWYQVSLLNQGTGSGDLRLDQGTAQMNKISLPMNEGTASGDSGRRQYRGLVWIRVATTTGVGDCGGANKGDSSDCGDQGSRVAGSGGKRGSCLLWLGLRTAARQSQ